MLFIVSHSGGLSSKIIKQCIKCIVSHFECIVLVFDRQPGLFIYALYLINVNNPYFDEMKFELNSSSVRITPTQAAGAGGTGIVGVLTALGGTGAPAVYDPHTNPEYAKYEKLGEEITQALTGAQQTVREEAAQAAAGPKMIKCPYCGAQTEIGAGSKCQYCGGYVGDAQ